MLQKQKNLIPLYHKTGIYTRKMQEKDGLFVTVQPSAFPHRNQNRLQAENVSTSPRSRSDKNAAVLSSKEPH